MRYVIANWKMYPQKREDALRIFSDTVALTQRLSGIRVAICPPFVWLSLVAAAAKSLVWLGAQDAAWAAEGAFTGEISPAMLKNIGCKMVIVGHSERRESGDTDEIVAQKLAAAFEYRLKPILCVGERERDLSGGYLKVLRAQLESALRKIPKSELKLLVIAYEPVWAIGVRARGASTPEDFLEQSIYIRKILSTLTDTATALRVPILYGGSVDRENAAPFLDRGRAHGLLVGRESLDAKEFGKILLSAEAL